MFHLRGGTSAGMTAAPKSVTGCPLPYQGVAATARSPQILALRHDSVEDEVRFLHHAWG